MAEGEVFDWSTAPGQMRAEFERLQGVTKKLEEQQAKDAARLAAFDRREAFERVRAELGDAAKEVSLEDLGDTPLEQITATTLKVKAQEKVEARATAELAQATALGYTDVETYRADIAALQAQRAKDTQGMTANAIAAGSGKAPPEIPAQPHEAAFAAYEKARQSGLPPDDRGAAAVDAMFKAAYGTGAK